MAQEKKYDVFISYSRKDSAIADEICGAFDQAGITYFIDRQGMGGTANYVTKIADEIDNSKAMLLLASANSYKSEYVSIELHYAFEKKIVVLPYALDKTQIPKDFKILLIRANWHYINEDPIVPKLLTSVSELVNKNIVFDVAKEKEKQIKTSPMTATNAELDRLRKEKELQERIAQAEDEKQEKEMIEAPALIESAKILNNESQESSPKILKKIWSWIAVAAVVIIVVQISGVRYFLYPPSVHVKTNDSIDTAQAVFASLEKKKNITTEKVEYWFQKGADYDFARNGVKQDDVKAFEYYLKAARNGHAIAQYNVGVCYNFGKGVEKNYNLSLMWYHRAAEQGCVWAFHNLGYCYEAGLGVTQDYVEALKWYNMAAEKGYTSSICNIGNFYRHGRSVDQDHAEALKWYRRAAIQGVPEAQYNVGMCYENGEGVNKVIYEAIEWYSKAAKQGHELARKRVDELSAESQQKKKETSKESLETI